MAQRRWKILPGGRIKRWKGSSQGGVHRFTRWVAGSGRLRRPSSQLAQGVLRVGTDASPRRWLSRSSEGWGQFGNRGDVQRSPSRRNQHGSELTLAGSTVSVLLCGMAIEFRNQGTEDVFNGVDSKAARKVCPPELVDRAREKLFLLDDAEELQDLLVPPGNRLEALKADRKAQHSIRINDQFRVCFRWTERGAEDVEIVDYHS